VASSQHVARAHSTIIRPCQVSLLSAVVLQSRGLVGYPGCWQRGPSSLSIRLPGAISGQSFVPGAGIGIDIFLGSSRMLWFDDEEGDEWSFEQRIDDEQAAAAEVHAEYQAFMAAAELPEFGLGEPQSDVASTEALGFRGSEDIAPTELDSSSEPTPEPPSPEVGNLTPVANDVIESPSF